MLPSPGSAARVLLHLLLVCNSLGYAAKLLGEVKRIEVLLGGKVAMPCDVSSKNSNDSLLLLVWYKANKPFYSYDGRLLKHWRSPDFPGRSRVLFTFHSEPAALLLDRAELADEGVYRCRADFNLSPTRNRGIFLFVVILPSKPFFMDEIGTKVENTVGPFHEGDNLLLTCMAVGGKPPPRLSWWKSSMLLDITDEPSEVPGLMENQLLLPLTREYSGASIQCLATNNNSTAPLATAVTIELYVSPETVVILSSQQALSAGSLYELPCFVNGSHPLPEVSWWLDGKIITDHQIVTEAAKNEIMSILHFKPKVENNGKDLTCQATNKILTPSQASKKHTIRLNVFFSPIITLLLVTNKHGMNTVQEGEIFQLRCMVEANPWISNTEWFANNMTVQGSSFNGSEISLSSSDLLILNASYLHSGNYTCAAFNLEGSGVSEDLEIIVLYKPFCQQKETFLHHKTSSLSCPIEALPSPSKYYWRIENQNESKLNENIHISDNNSLSFDTFRVMPHSFKKKDELVVVACWAANEVGEQKIPCFLKIDNPPRNPEPPEDCKINAEPNSLIVNCSPGSNETVYQMFGLSIWHTVNNTRVLINNITSPLSTIRIGNLKHGQSYEVITYSFNEWGESEAVVLNAKTFDSSLAFSNSQADIGLWSGVVVGILVTLILLLTICIVKKKKKSVATDNKKIKCDNPSNNVAEKQGYGVTSLSDVAEKPLLYMNGKTIPQNIILTRNNSEPKNIDNMIIVQNIDDKPPVPPSISRKNKPRPQLPNGALKDGRKLTSKTKGSFIPSKHKKEMKKANGHVIPLHERNGISSEMTPLRMLTLSKESIV